MTRALLSRILPLSLLIVGWVDVQCTSLQAASGPAGEVWSEADRTTLLRYARDTWRSFDELALPSGLPADALVRTGSGWSRSLTHTSPTNIGAYLWSVLAAQRLRLIGPAEARARLDLTLTRLAGMERSHGFFVNELDPRTGAPLKFPEAGPGARQPPTFRGGQRLAGRGAVDDRQRRAVAPRTMRGTPAAHGFPVLP